jgi:MFS family permease
VTDAAHRPLTRRDAKVLALASLGGALEFYDFVVYVFFATTLSQLFFPKTMSVGLKDFQAFGIFAAGYLARPVGGMVMAHFGDLVGRKRMFMLSVLLMALPTFAIALLPTFATAGFLAPILLLTLRILQGMAIGGEIPGAWVFASEHVPGNRTGLACGSLKAGLTAGILCGSLVASALTHELSPAQMQGFGWRLPFLLGGVFGVIAVYLRRWLDETPVFEEMRRDRRLATRLPLSLVFAEHRAALISGMLMTLMLTTAIVVVILMTPPLLQRGFHLAPALVLDASCAGNLGLSIGCVLAGLAVDRFGMRPTVTLGGIALAAMTFTLYHTAAVAPDRLVDVYAVTGLCVGTIAVVPVSLVRGFPPTVRFSGIAAAYNLAYALFGGLTPLLIAALPLHLVPVYVAAICGLGIVTAYTSRRDHGVAAKASSSALTPVSLTAPPSAL